ncbi:MAG TPA: RNA polymerase sigma factor [Patescibacteria group bacterium]|nr:RNA polymerase sigma factor [Patescibacteria group bacterium]
MSANIVKKFKDKQALDRLKKRDREAFTKAYDDNVNDIYRFVYYKIGSDEEAKDITSAIFLKTWNHIQNNTLESAKTLRALLYKVARSTIIDYYRANGRTKIISLEDDKNRVDVATYIDEDARIDIQRDIEIVRSKLPLLKEEYKEIIVMRFINELELDEIADITGKSKGNIRVLTHRALKALKDLLLEDEEEKKNE